mmetsp:Transcript_46115/g.142052  ORF Transcript_46115/g.142052 Transcript_46115/m.142052 type:complete len:213 (-) Transcript_46115:3206-3844(-)
MGGGTRCAVGCADGGGIDSGTGGGAATTGSGGGTSDVYDDAAPWTDEAPGAELPCIESAYEERPSERWYLGGGKLGGACDDACGTELPPSLVPVTDAGGRTGGIGTEDPPWEEAPGIGGGTLDITVPETTLVPAPPRDDAGPPRDDAGPTGGGGTREPVASLPSSRALPGPRGGGKRPSGGISKRLSLRPSCDGGRRPALLPVSATRACASG